MAAIIATGFVSVVGATAVVFVLPSITTRFAALSHHALYAVAFVAGSAFMTLSTVLDYTFVAERSTDKMAVRNAVFAGAAIPLVAIAPVIGVAGTLGVLSAWSAAAVLGVVCAIVLVWRLRRGYRRVLAGTAAELRAMAPSLPLQHIISLAAGLSPYLLSPLVAAELSPRANAHFYTAWMVGSVFFIISPAVSWSLFAEGRREASSLATTVRRAAVITAALLLPLMTVFLLFGHYALGLFGHGYVAYGRGLLTILVLSAIPDAVTNLYTGAMLVRGTLVPAAVLNVAMSAGTLAIAWMLLPRLGIVGAGCAWIISQSAGCVVVAGHVVLIRRRRPAIARK